jgi:hypothetical protein
MTQQLEHIMTSTEEHPAPYPFNIDIGTQLPRLLDDLKPFISFGRTDRTMHPLMPRALMRGTIVHELFLGGRGASYPVLHYDLLGLHTQMTQIMGEKEFVFYDPSQTPFLYPSALNPRLSSLPNILTPDLEKFPLFRKARPVSVLLREGETIFFPGGWWHITRMHGPSISYGRVVVNASNWNDMLRENLHRWRTTHPALATGGYMFGKVLGGVFSALEAMRGRG